MLILYYIYIYIYHVIIIIPFLPRIKSCIFSIFWMTINTQIHVLLHWSCKKATHFHVYWVDLSITQTMILVVVALIFFMLNFGGVFGNLLSIFPPIRYAFFFHFSRVLEMYIFSTLVMMLNCNLYRSQMGI